MVFRALYRERLPRALKFIIPRDDLAEDSGEDMFRSSFQTEVEALAEASHAHIARLTDFGSTLSGIPYVATEYVDGLPLDEFAKSDATSGPEILECLKQLRDALGYLHRLGIMHCDVKPQNCVVTRRDGRVVACLLDLGVSHHLGPDNPDDEWTYFFPTPGFFLPKLEYALANKAHNRIRLSELRRAFPAQDIYSYGVVLKTLLNDPIIARRIAKATGADGPAAILNIAQQILTNQSEGAISDIPSLSHAMDRVSPNVLAPLGDRILRETGQWGVALPGIPDRIALTGSVTAIISHPLFQRLHQLPQVDLLQYVLPGSSHTRFAHALQTFHLAKKAINYLLSDWRFRINVQQEEIDATLVASLVDSVGRYQLLHMFEDFLPNRGTWPKAHLKTSEEIVASMLGKGNSQFDSQLAGTLDDRGRTFSEVLGERWWKSRAMLATPTSPVQGVLAALLDSPIDVSKLAYVRGDSLATGLPFGRGVRAEALFEQLRLPGDAEWHSSTQTRRVILGLREDGISFAEVAILARYWNIQTGYWNRTNRSLQSMVKYVIGELIENETLDFEEYMMATLNEPIHVALTWLSNKYDKLNKAGEGVNPISDLLVSRRESYPRLLTISPRSPVGERKGDARIYDAIKGRSALGYGAVIEAVREVLESEVPGLDSVRSGEILLDVPRAQREDSRGRILVYADPPDPAYLDELHKASPVLQNLGQSFELFVKRMRFFIHPRIMKKIDGHDGRIHEALLERLRSDAQEGRL